MSWRLRLSVETILRLTPAVLGSTVFSIAELCAAHACLGDQVKGRGSPARADGGKPFYPRCASDTSILVTDSSEANHATLVRDLSSTPGALDAVELAPGGGQARVWLPADPAPG